MRAAIKFIQKKLSPNTGLHGVEVGVEKGDHALEILKALYMKWLVLVDIWGPFEQEDKIIWNKDITEANYKTVIERFGDNPSVHIMKCNSVEAAKKHNCEGIFDFVYLDASHQYENVLEDLKTWMPKVRIGGILCGHDYIDVWPGVRKAVNEFAIENKLKLQTGNTPEEPVPDWWMVIE